jgi:ribosomal protein S18 acetylase RimI-like enzyme
MEVRRLTSDDWELLRTVRLAALQEAPYAFRRTYEEASQNTEEVWRQQAGDRTALDMPCATFAGVRSDGTAAGMACGIDDGTKVHVVAVWVAPEERGSGLFDRLMEAVTEWAPRDVLTLNVAEGNARALAAYQRHGYEVVGEEAGELVMERAAR